MLKPNPSLLLGALCILLGACNTVPTSSSSGSSSGPPPSSSGSPSSPPSSAGSQGSQKPSSSQSGQDTGQGQQTATSGEASSAGQAGSQADKQNGAGQKSEDEILADALGEFEKGFQGSEPQSSEQGRAAAGSSAGGGSGQKAMTEEEKARILDAQLGDEFAKFDEQMLGEREQIAKGENERGGGGNGYDDGEGDGEGSGYGDDPMQTAMADQQPLPPRGGGFPGDIKRDDISPAPPDVGDGQDDDIIARQLREAAQKEKDPELRAKLWEEYRKYKKGV